jgi:hypothetical protein
VISFYDKETNGDLNLKWAMKVRLSEITNPRFFWRAYSVKLTDRIQPRGVRGDNTVVRDSG